MKLLKKEDLLNFDAGTALTIGVFDGVHSGHQEIIRNTVEEAKAKGLDSLLLTFSSHPLATLYPVKKPPLLASLEHRLKLIESLGIDYCYVQEFSREFARTEPVDFIKKWLMKNFHPEFICVGGNFHFGRGKKGDTVFLKKVCSEMGIGVKIVKPVEVEGARVSSTFIRGLIESGRVKESERCLGRKYSIVGTVVKGKGVGKKIGFPTANIDPHNEAMPPIGVYLTRVIYDGNTFDSVTNVGSEVPEGWAFDRIVEAHILDFNENILGKNIEIIFFDKLREELKFDKTEDLSARIRDDVEKANRFFAKERLK
ncbi:MAG: bifunctional riboflavin kinase/FAD synthetase [Candidatus Aureabacteria bacterium]|nr:bifunctional riboflavin kinase/FAD synthetase [Candidatus Auribacterota bacterium]